MSQRVMGGLLIVLLIIVLALELTGTAPGVGSQTLPLLILLGGAYAIWRAVRPPRAAQTHTDVRVPLEGATSAALHLTFGAGGLTLAAGDPDTPALTGTCTGQIKTRTSRDAENLSITLRQPFSLIRQRADWQIALAPAVPWEDLRLTLGAADARVDLRGLAALRRATIEAGGTTLDADLPASGEVSVQISGGSTTLRVPARAAVIIDSEIRLGEVVVDETRFHPDGSGMHWASPESAAGVGALHIMLAGGLGRVEITGA